MGSVYQRASDGRWVAASSKGPRGARMTTVRYARTREEAEALIVAMGETIQPKSASERFWEKVLRGPGCWEWQGFRVGGLYGVFWDGERRVIASRFAYEDAVGPIPAGRYALHRCDNPPCVRPGHLFLGTHADNAADMIAKGRANYQRRVVRVSGTTPAGADVGSQP